MGNIIIGTSVFLLFLTGMFYLSYQMYGRAKRRYWELYRLENDILQRVMQLQNQLQNQTDRLQEQAERIQHHLLLEHLAGMAAGARSKGLMSSEGYDKTFRTIHEMEMDNWEGKK